MYTRQLDQAGFKAKLSCYYSSLRIKPFSMQIKLSSCLEKKAVVARIVCTSLETSQIITQSKHIQRMTWEVDETRIFCRKLRFPRCLYVLYMIYVYVHIYIPCEILSSSHGALCSDRTPPMHLPDFHYAASSHDPTNKYFGIQLWLSSR